MPLLEGLNLGIIQTDTIDHYHPLTINNSMRADPQKYSKKYHYESFLHFTTHLIRMIGNGLRLIV